MELSGSIPRLVRQGMLVLFLCCLTLARDLWDQDSEYQAYDYDGKAHSCSSPGVVCTKGEYCDMFLKTCRPCNSLCGDGLKYPALEPHCKQLCPSEYHHLYMATKFTADSITYIFSEDCSFL